MWVGVHGGCVGHGGCWGRYVGSTRRRCRVHGRRRVARPMEEWLERMRRRWSVIDALQGTRLGEHGKKEGCGLWLIQDVVPGDTVHEWMESSETMFSQFPTRTRVGNRNEAYHSIQAVEKGCRCKDNYAGAGSHRLVELPDATCEVLSRSLDWAHRVLGTGSGKSMVFNEAIANRYEVWHQDIPWHTDANALLGLHPTILSISLGPVPGVLCYAPRKGMGWGGERGMVLLKPGDVLVMFGAFQQFFEHRTLKHEDIWRQPDVVLGDYAAVNEFIRPSLVKFFNQVAEGDALAQSADIRHVISLRNIVHHKAGCPVGRSCRALRPVELWKRYFYIHMKYVWTNEITNERFFEATGNEDKPGSRRPTQQVKPRKWTQYRYDGGRRWWYNVSTEDFFFEDETTPVVSGNAGVWIRGCVSEIEYWWWHCETGDHWFE